MTSTIIEFPNAISTPAPTTPRKRRRRGPYKPRAPKEPKVERDFTEERVTAYSDLEPHICDVVNGTDRGPASQRFRPRAL